MKLESNTLFQILDYGPFLLTFPLQKKLDELCLLNENSLVFRN